jgi:hypothetical protein
VPGAQPGVAREPDHRFARRGVVPADQYVALDHVVCVLEMDGGDVLEGRYHLYTRAEPALQRKGGGTAFRQLHTIDARRHERHCDVDQDLALKIRAHRECRRDLGRVRHRQHDHRPGAGGIGQGRAAQPPPAAGEPL